MGETGRLAYTQQRLSKERHEVLKMVGKPAASWLLLSFVKIILLSEHPLFRQAGLAIKQASHLN